MNNDLKEFRKMTYEQNDNINNEMEIIKIQILQLKSKITEMKIPLQEFKSKFEQEEKYQ